MNRTIFKLALCFSIPLGLHAQLVSVAAPTFELADAVLPSAVLPGVALPDASLPNAPLPQNVSTSATPVEPAQALTAQQTEAQRREKAEAQLKAQESQRILGLVPAFNEVIGGEAEPLTPGEKFRLFFRGSIDPYQFVIVGIDAGIEQAQDSYPEYHYGFEGFAKRYGAAFADNFDGNFWGNAVLPSLLHQDPRYFRLGEGKPLHRILYSAFSTVRAKSDSGKWQPNYSNVFGNLIGGAISNIYYPASDRGLGLTFERGLTVSAEGAIGALAEEFYPDLAKYLAKRKAKKQAAAQAAGTP